MGEGYLTWMKRAESALFGAMVHLDGIMIWHFNGKAITKKLQTCLIPFLYCDEWIQLSPIISAHTSSMRSLISSLNCQSS